MKMRHRIIRVLALASLLLMLVPNSAAGAPSADSCAGGRAVPFSTEVPNAVREPGTHRFEWRSTFTDENGGLAEAFAQNQVKIVPGMTIYPNTVLLRLFRNTTLVSGELMEVPEMSPNQPAVFYIAADSIKGDDVFLDSFRTWFRYESTRNHWSAWVELPPGPETNFCNQLNDAIWKKTFGWG